MEFFVIGPDGKDYGPATVDTLRQWAEQNRVLPTTMLKNSVTGEVVAASAVPGILPATPPPPAAQNWSQPPSGSPYPRQGTAQQPVQSGGDGPLWRSILYSVGAVVLFFFLHGLGLIFASYGMYYAVQTQRQGHRGGMIAIVVAAIALVVVGIGWAMRLSGAGA